MNGVILYQSKYGATKKYAQWLSEETGFPIVETKKAKIEDIRQYGTIILGGGVYASGVAGLSFLKKNMDALQGRKIMAFVVGASPYDENDFQAVVQHNMKDALRNIPCFYCRGAFDMDAMTVVDRSLCKMLQKSVAKKKPEDLENWEKALMAAKDEPRDWTDREYLQPILQMLK